MKGHSSLIGIHAKPGAWVVMLLAITSMYSASGWAFENLNLPQQLIYDTSHLAKTESGATIVYAYTSHDTDLDETVEDFVKLNIQKIRPDDRRDVSVEFLSGSLKISLPAFDNYRGNPVIIGMLEHLAQAIGRDTGGGALYFRNRIRDKLADESIEVVESKTTAGGKDSEITRTSFSISPLRNDPYVADRSDLTESVITLSFSDDLPGGLLAIEFASGPVDNPKTTRVLRYLSVNRP